MVDSEIYVRNAVAGHLGIAPETVAARAHLASELSLDPLDLVLIVLRLEESVGFEVPVEGLAYIETVGDFVALVESASHGREPLPLRPSPTPPAFQVRPRRARGAL